MPVDIPAGLQDSHFFTIKGFLHTILNELRAEGTGARRVVSRLNDSNKTQASPVFLGVVEDDAITDQRRQSHAASHGDVGKARFKDTNASKVYEDTVNDHAGDIVSRNWNMDQPPTGSGRNPKGLGKIANCVHQRFIAIRIAGGGGHQHVGTITVGFTEPPNPQQNLAIERIMKKWAQTQSDYVKYLRQTFNLNGPTP